MPASLLSFQLRCLCALASFGNLSSATFSVPQREERIKRNQAMLRALNLQQLAADLQATCSSAAGASSRSRPAHLQRKPAEKRQQQEIAPTRRSVRKGGQDALGSTAVEGRPFQELDENAGAGPSECCQYGVADMSYFMQA